MVGAPELWTPGGAVRFSYAESMTDPSFYLPLAQAAEAAGFDSMVVPDSICYPEVSDTTYPFNPDGTREFLEDKPFLEPFSLIPAMGALTENLRFVTFVIKLPIRQPGADHQAGELDGGADQQPAAARRRHQPVARGLRDLRRAVGAPGQADGRGDRHHARPHGRGLLRVPRRGLRRAVHQNVPDADRARADPHRRPPRGGAAAGGRRTATAGCTAGETRPTCPGCWPAWPSCAGSTGPRTSRSRST